MFNLEQSIAAWRQEISSAGIKSPELIEELESHLREEFAHRLRSCPSPEEAFAVASQQIGAPALLESEFRKVHTAGRRWPGALKQGLATLAGIPSPVLATGGGGPNVSLGAEPAWATYTKCALFVSPAIFIWWFSLTFILPKLNQICKQAGMAVPSEFHLIPWLAQYWGWCALGVMAAVALLEWRSRYWPRFRRAIIGLTVIAINALVLVTTTLMVILALVAIPALGKH
jgi:hypothetical protein